MYKVPLERNKVLLGRNKVFHLKSLGRLYLRINMKGKNLGWGSRERDTG